MDLCQRSSGESLRLRGRDIAGVRRAGGFDQQYVSFFIGDRPMLDALRHNEKLTRAKLDGPVAQLDPQSSFKNEKEVVGVGVRVPNEFALGLHDHNVVPVKVRYDSRLKRLVERRELFCEVNFFHR